MVVVGGWGSWFLFRVTCVLGRGRGRVPAHDLRSSSRARLSTSNCLSCSRTEASREAVLDAHRSIRLGEQSGAAEGDEGRKRVNRHRGSIRSTGGKVDGIVHKTEVRITLFFLNIGRLKAAVADTGGGKSERESERTEEIKKQVAGAEKM